MHYIMGFLFFVWVYQMAKEEWNDLDYEQEDY